MNPNTAPMASPAATGMITNGVIAGAAPGTPAGVPGMLAVVQDPLQFDGSSMSGPIIPTNPGDRLLAVGPTDLQSMQAANLQQQLQQVMMPNAGGQQQGQASQQRLRGRGPDGSLWEAQRTSIVWQNNCQ